MGMQYWIWMASQPQDTAQSGRQCPVEEATVFFILLFVLLNTLCGLVLPKQSSLETILPSDIPR